MQVLYLIRHGRPEIPEGGTICLGRKDLPLSYEGKKQAESLSPLLVKTKDLLAVSSPLLRSLETAGAAGFPDVSVNDAFTEIDTGKWDGLPFEEIKKRWPAEYAGRGADLVHYAPPEGESFEQCRKRAETALEEILKKQRFGDILVFTHKGVIQALNSVLTGEDPDRAFRKNYGYACVEAFLLKEGRLFCDPVFLHPGQEDPIPDEKKCQELSEKYGTPHKVRDHCKAVAEKAMVLCGKLEKKGYKLNKELIFAAASLHDIARAHRQHADIGARWIFSEGYPSVAAVIGDHMSLPEEEERISEKSVVFLADKYVKETRSVSLQERYLQDRPADRLAFAKEKLAQAERIEKLFQEE